jgi:hypothetical protein
MAENLLSFYRVVKARRAGKSIPMNPGVVGAAPYISSEFVTFLSSGCSLRPESSQEHLPTSIAGVLRLRAMKHLLGDRSARRFAQDDGLVGVLKAFWLGVPKAREIKKVTTSQDDGLVGVLKNTCFWMKGVPRLQRSGSWGLISQPSRAGLTFGSRPSGPRRG